MHLHLIKETNPLFERMLHYVLFKTRGNDKIVTVHAIKTYTGAEVQLHWFTISASDRDKWSASRFGHFITGKEALQQLNRGLGAPQSRSFDILKKNSLALPWLETQTAPVPALAPAPTLVTTPETPDDKAQKVK